MAHEVTQFYHITYFYWKFINRACTLIALMADKSRCRLCLLPAAVPGSELDAAGVCRPCREYSPAAASTQSENKRKQFELDLDQTLREAHAKGREYDCLVSFSGGKDSVYILYRLIKEYKLRVLAYTLDFDLPNIAWDNIRRTVKALDVEHLVYAPPKDFYKKMTRYLLMNQLPGGAVETVCYIWAPLRDGGAVRLASERRIPLVFIGYSPGQADPYGMEYELPSRMVAQTDWTPQSLRESGQFTSQELAEFWNPLATPPEHGVPRVLAPLHAWPYNQAEVMRSIVDWGLVSDKKHANPVYSNFSMNWLLMYSDLLNLGYNPYAPEFARLIREGKASRAQWQILSTIVDWMIRRRVLLGSNITKSLRWLELSPEDLRIKKS